MSCPDIWMSRAIQFSTRFRQVTAIAGTIGISQRLALPKGALFPFMAFKVMEAGTHARVPNLRKKDMKSFFWIGAGRD